MPKAINLEGEEVEVEVGSVVYLKGELIAMTVTAVKGDQITCVWLSTNELDIMSYDFPVKALWVGERPSYDEEEDDDGD